MLRRYILTGTIVPEDQSGWACLTELCHREPHLAEVIEWLGHSGGNDIVFEMKTRPEKTFFLTPTGPNSSMLEEAPTGSMIVNFYVKFNDHGKALVFEMFYPRYERVKGIMELLGRPELDD